MLVDDVQEFREAERLAEEASSPEFMRNSGRIFFRRHHDHRWIDAARLKLPVEAPAVKHWHAHVEEHERRPFVLDAVQTFPPVRGEPNREATRLESNVQRTPYGRVVFDDEDWTSRRGRVVASGGKALLKRLGDPSRGSRF